MSFQRDLFAGRGLGTSICAVGLFLLLLAPGRVQAADPAFVGSLAIAVEPQSVERLGLSEETVKALKALVERRENEAINMALEIRELPPSERARRLEPFVAESERLGMELLTVEQRSKLSQIRIHREGMLTLGQPHIAKLLALSEEQVKEVQRLFAERAQAMTQGGEQDRRVTRDTYERKLREILTDTQKATWDGMAGVGPGPKAAGAPESAVAGEPSKDDVKDTPPVVPETVAAGEGDGQATPAATAPASMPDSGVESVDENAKADPVEPTEAVEDSEASPSDDVPAESGVAEEAAMKTADGEPLLRFNFKHHPWEDVLDWLAEQADLSLQSEIIPDGTFSYSDTRSYTATEAIDLINGMLLIKGYTLVRRGRLLTVIDLEDEVPDVLVEFVPVEKLDERGEFELIKTVFHLAKMEPSDAQVEIQQLLGPGRALVVMPKARQIMVTETAGNLRAIRDVLEKAENPSSGETKRVTEIKLKNATAEEVMMIARPLLGLGDGENTGDEINIAIDAMGARLFATGGSDKIAVLQDVVLSVDVESMDNGDETNAAMETPQLRTHPIQVADPEGALAVLQTLLAGSPDVRLALDPKTNKIIALARPTEHKLVVDTIAQLEGEEAQFEVIQLRRVDPQMAVLTINNFFGVEEDDASGIKVDADPTTMKLFLRATKSQSEQVKMLIEKLEGSGSGSSVGGNLRYIPLSGDGALSTVEMAKRLWSRKNQIQFVEPSSGGPSKFDLREVSPELNRPRPDLPPKEAPTPAVEPARPASGRAPKEASPSQVKKDRLATVRENESSGHSPLIRLVSQTVEDETAKEEPVAAQPANEAKEEPAAESKADQEATAEGKGSDIRIEFTPEGVIIASEDTEALDEFEELLRTIAGPTSLLPGKNFTVFFLKYCKADIAQQLIQDILGGSSSAAGGSLIGDVASNLLGGGGGILGALMGGGGGGGSDATTIQATGPVSIIADPRLNCLVVQAVPTDLQLIEQLLKVIDREASITEVQTAGRPHIIPVIYMQADEVANVVREAYAARIASNQSQGQRQPNPADLIRALRGGGRGGRGGSEEARGEESKMTVTVDARSNSLIVTAPEPLYLEVKELVAQIDRAGLDQVEDVRVVTVKGTNPESIQKVLSSILQSSSRSSGSSSSPSNGTQRTPGSPFGGSSAADIQRRMQFMQQMGGMRGGIQPGGMGRGGSTGRGGAPSSNRGGRGGGRGGGGGRGR